jgi:AcrR family transcriptional regulator
MTGHTKSKRYHHGDLRRAILDAGEEELSERGVAGFSLRRVAARVGVSHTAPAHHFGDAAGLIDALAERGFRSLVDCMEARQERAIQTAYERLIATGQGYLDFALSEPAMFRLIFGLDQTPAEGSSLQAAALSAFMTLARAVGDLRGADPMLDPEGRIEVLACWTRAHGIADLILSGYIELPDGENAEAERDAFFRKMLAVNLSPRDV